MDGSTLIRVISAVMAVVVLGLLVFRMKKKTAH